MNPFEMVVLIVAISAVASIFRAKYGIPGRARRRDRDMPIHDPENDRLREELRALKDRVAVLERIATDNDRGLQLDREIEALRHRD
ncbi:hypothetical protein SAMN05444678_110126 [Sphingomonas sp. YR710]|jgi:hypothetical protein|uniref:hypothetical protein n=1 Tax=Sphingomonas sp. YR710 TaxID=1882773 RepID=UPI00056C29F9|nr:hypothetical protein [Sphingomonas sp. YR710]SDD21669.1 hypothetical protein SAMN05444678_110126 [Sphingomonas sp. YR710]